MALNIDFLETYDQKSIKTELRRIAKVTGKQTLAKSDIDQFGKVRSGTVIKKFGSLHKAHTAAGLVPGILKTATDLELLEIVVEVWTITEKKFGRSPMMSEVRELGFPITGQTIAERFGTWRKALVAASKMASNSPNWKKRTATKAALEGRRTLRRNSLSLRSRFFVFRRDSYTCQMCKRAGGELHVDHVIPLCRGGSDDLENLQTLCSKCNMGKGGNLE